jgi:hypothetical protein
LNNEGKKNKLIAFGLGALQVFIGVGGIAGGLGLVTEPNGSNLGFQVELLNKSPFSDYLIPGIFLLTVNGIGSLAGGVLSFLRNHFAGMCAAVLGFILMIWIVAQVWWIGLVIWLQPLFFGFGLAELVLGLLLWRTERRAEEEKR